MNQTSRTTAVVAEQMRAYLLDRFADASVAADCRGPLNSESGFLPHRLPSKTLPAAFAAWDEVALAMPELVTNLTLRREVNKLPWAPWRTLPQANLRRAASLLSILAHAYRTMLPDDTIDLPPTLAAAWFVVCERLDRPTAMMTYADLIAFNWQLIDPNKPRTAKNLRLLLPVVDLPEEQTFYLTQTEILANSGPLLCRTSRTLSFAARQDWDGVEHQLRGMRQVMQRLNKVQLAGLTAMTKHPRAIDPVIWARMVAPMAVAISCPMPGPSGTANPLIHLLDELTGRKGFVSQLGVEAKALRATYPLHWRRLFAGLSGRVALHEHLNGAPQHVQDLWQDTLALYTGPEGFLNLHRRKVFGFMEVAFKMGRTVTIGGFQGAFDQRKWNEVDDALVESMSERLASRCPMGFVAPSQLEPAQSSGCPITRLKKFFKRSTKPVLAGPAAIDLPRWSEQEFFEQALTSDTTLLRLGNRIYNVTPFMSRHPGGAPILTLYHGRRADQAWQRVEHHTLPGVPQLLAGMAVAELHQHKSKIATGASCPISSLLNLPPASIAASHVPRRPFIEACLELRQAIRVEAGIFGAPLTRADQGGRAQAGTPLRRWHCRHTVQRALDHLQHWLAAEPLGHKKLQKVVRPAVAGFAATLGQGLDLAAAKELHQALTHIDRLLTAMARAANRAELCADQIFAEALCQVVRHHTQHYRQLPGKRPLTMPQVVPIEKTDRSHHAGVLQ